MNAKEYLLVFQFEASSLEDFDELIALEQTISKHLANGSVVDGHDFGCGEFNIFIFTFSLEADLRAGIRFLETKVPVTQIKAGYRALDEDDYTALYPEGLNVFKVA
jgi:hypothetical protein